MVGGDAVPFGLRIGVALEDIQTYDVLIEPPCQQSGLAAHRLVSDDPLQHMNDSHVVQHDVLVFVDVHTRPRRYQTVQPRSYRCLDGDLLRFLLVSFQSRETLGNVGLVEVLVHELRRELVFLRKLQLIALYLFDHVGIGPSIPGLFHVKLYIGDGYRNDISCRRREVRPERHSYKSSLDDQLNIYIFIFESHESRLTHLAEPVCQHGPTLFVASRPRIRSFRR